MIIDVPIEPLHERYSIQWNEWFYEACLEHKVPLIRALSTRLTDKIETGSFLDVHGTNYWKAGQLKTLVQMLQKGSIKDGDWILFHDLWFPGIEMLAYIRDASGVKFKIAGCLHAGTWDRWDYINQKTMTPWARKFENMLLEIVDKVFVATNFHRNLIGARFQNKLQNKVVVTGFPIYPDKFVRKDQNKDPNLIVFPHRMDPEKQPNLFNELMDNLHREVGNHLNFIFTKRSCSNKTEYYELLAQAKYAVSFARQETWGIAMQEALFSGCITFVPRRLAYMEMYDSHLQYRNMMGLKKALIACLTNPEAQGNYEMAALQTAITLRNEGADAIPNMLQEMGFLK